MTEVQKLKLAAQLANERLEEARKRETAESLRHAFAALQNPVFDVRDIVSRALAGPSGGAVADHVLTQFAECLDQITKAKGDEHKQ